MLNAAIHAVNPSQSLSQPFSRKNGAVTAARTADGDLQIVFAAEMIHRNDALEKFRLWCKNELAIGSL